MGQKRVWFAEAPPSGSASEVRRLLVRARGWAERLGLPARRWVSDKQDAFVTGVAAESPGVPHRYCANHFVRDLAQPVLDADSHAKVQMRKEVRGLRGIERDVLAEQAGAQPHAAPAAGGAAGPAGGAAGAALGLDYCGTPRGILNDDQGGPLHPPGERMAEAPSEVRQSLQRNLDAKRGGPRTTASPG